MTGWIESFALQQEEFRQTEQLSKQFKTAKDLGADHCVCCGFCCHRRSCIPTPDELLAVAEFLKMTVVDLIKTYYCVDERSGVYFVKPAGANQKDLLGKYIPWRRTFNEGACIFLKDDNKCAIWPVRPESARGTRCWDDDGEDYWPPLMQAWSNKKLAEVYPVVVDFEEE